MFSQGIAMKTWNLSTFDELSTQVVTSEMPAKNSRPPNKSFRGANAPRTARVSFLGAAILVAAITSTSQKVVVFGSGGSFQLTVHSGTWNLADERPPLHLLFGGRHVLKWDAQREQEMLEKALAASEPSPVDDRRNAIQAALFEDLPSSHENTRDLGSLGVRLG